jgi:non-heme chloroperoxidase
MAKTIRFVPINISGKRLAKLIRGATEIFDPGLPHGLTATNADQVNAALLKLLKSVQEERKAA